MAKFIEEEEKTEKVMNEPSSDTQIYTMKSQIGHERTASERLADRVRTVSYTHLTLPTIYSV